MHRKRLTMLSAVCFGSAAFFMIMRMGARFLIIIGLLAAQCGALSAATSAYIPERFRGVILYAPVPSATRYSNLGIQGVYRLTINPKSGTVEEVGVLKPTGYQIMDATVVLEFIKWKFKPGSIKQLDVPVMFEDPIRVELRKAVSR